MMKHAEPTFDMAGGGGGGGNSDKIKLIVAVVALVAAGLVLAWNFGLLGGGSKPKPLPGPATQEEQEILDESDRISREQLEKAKKDPNVTIGGA